MVSAADSRRVITLLGGAAIHVDGAPIGGRAAHRHPIAILALLVTNGGRPLSRDKLIALLWPERDGEAARNLLKVNVHELRKELGDGVLRSTADQLSVDIDAIACDVTDFLAAIERGDDEAAVALYHGPLLDGFFIKDAVELDQWVESERARFAGLYAAALERLAAAAESRGDPRAAVQWRRAQAAHDPYHGEIANRLVRALAAAGDRAGAIQFAESFATRWRRDFSMSDEHDIVSFARRLNGTYTPETPLAPPVVPGRVPVLDPVTDAPTPPTPPVTPATRAMPHGAPMARRIWIGVAALVVIGTTLIIGRRTSLARPARAPAEIVAVAPFRVVGSDSAIRDGLAAFLAARFNGVGGARAIDPSNAAPAWKSATPANGQPSLDAALATARTLGATQLIIGEIVSARDSVAIAARLYGVATRSLVASARADVSTSTSIGGIADRLAIELMARAAGNPDDRIAELIARPLAASRSYVAGERAYRAARYAKAESLYAQALRADSTFGAAGLGLALANSWTGINDDYGMGRDAAERYRRAMSERDRAFVDAFFGPDPALGPPRPAPVYLTAWEDVVERWPDWTEAWYELGDRYYHFGALSGLADPAERARAAFRRALAQDSTFVAPLHHLVELYAARGELANLRATGVRYFAANPSVNRNRSVIGWEMATALGDNEWLRRIRANFDAMPRDELTRIGWVTDANGWPSADAERAATIVNRTSSVTSEREKALILSFALNLNAGHTQEARVAAVGLGAIFPNQPVGALWDMYAALFGDGDSTLAADAAKRLAAFADQHASGDHVARDQHHLSVCMVGLWAAGRGDAAAARSAIDHVRAELRTEDNGFARRNASVCLAMVSATIAVRSHTPDAKSAVARLDTILLRERVPPHAILEGGTIVAARLHAQLGDTAAALVAARRREHLTGDPLFLSTQLREEARYARAMNDSAGAARAAAHLEALRRP